MSTAYARDESSWEVPPSFNIAADVLDRLALENRTGLIFIDSYGYRRDYRFAEVADLSQRYAAALRDLGVQQGERVLLLLPPVAKTVFVALAIDRVGAVAVLCEPDCSTDELTDRVLETGATTIVANRSSRDAAEPLRGASPLLSRYLLIGDDRNEWVRLDTAADGKAPFRGVISRSDDEAFIRYEDGRGMIFDRAYLYACGKNAQSYLDARPSDIIWHSAGSVWEGIFAVWSCGSTPVLHEAPFDPRERLDLLREINVTVLVQPVGEYRSEVDLADFERFRLPHLRRCIAAGVCSDELIERWLTATRQQLLPSYGYPQGPIVAVTDANRSKAGCAGLPLPGLNIAILSGESRCQPQEIGEIAIRRDAPLLFRRFVGDESPPAGSWFRNGDRGYLDTDGCLWLP